MRPSHEHVHEIGHDVVQQALIMRDDELRVVGALQFVHAVRDDFERVDVQAGIGFVEDGELRFEHGHLENFVALLFAAGKTFIDRALRADLPFSSSSFIFSFTSARNSIASSSGSPLCLRISLSAALRK